MRLIVLACALALLSGCGAQYQARVACQEQAGPQPEQVGQMFGLIGALAMESSPDWQAWNRRVGACLRQKEGATRG